MPIPRRSRWLETLEPVPELVPLEGLAFRFATSTSSPRTGRSPARTTSSATTARSPTRGSAPRSRCRPTRTGWSRPASRSLAVRSVAGGRRGPVPFRVAESAGQRLPGAGKSRSARWCRPGPSGRGATSTTSSRLMSTRAGRGAARVRPPGRRRGSSPRRAGAARRPIGLIPHGRLFPESEQLVRGSRSSCVRLFDRMVYAETISISDCEANRGSRLVAFVLAALAVDRRAGRREPVPGRARARVRDARRGAPAFVTARPGIRDRVFVVRQGLGGPERYHPGDGRGAPATPFLDVTSISSGGERGLLSMAFAPDYETSRSSTLLHGEPTGR